MDTNKVLASLQLWLRAGNKKAPGPESHLSGGAAWGEGPPSEGAGGDESVITSPRPGAGLPAASGESTSLGTSDAQAAP
jgi:hypothetical protein